ncbi:MAG: hypothetical protein HOV97_05365 [Nonomuraea sp.]|nr:hypothetical protein [Nonomuraea sp.]
MSMLNPARDDTLCRHCDADLWKQGSHRRHDCQAEGSCLCPVCDNPAVKVRAVLDAIDGVLCAA